MGPVRAGKYDAVIFSGPSAFGAHRKDDFAADYSADWAGSAGVAAAFGL